MSEITIEQYLMNLPPELQAITRELCEVARKIMPSAYEFIYHDAVGYSASKSPFDRVCYIAPQRGYVNFGFFFGADLCGPRYLLVGEGKRPRRVKVTSMEDAKNPDLGKLVAAISKEAPESIARIHAGGKKNKS